MKNRSLGEKSQEKARGIKRWIFTGQITAVIVEMIVLLVLVVNWHIQRSEQFPARQQQMCYPRYKLNVAHNGTECPPGLEFHESNNETNCCGELSDVLDAVTNKTMLKRYDSEINPELLSFNLEKFNCKTTNQQISVQRLGLAQGRKSESSKKMFWEGDRETLVNTGLKYSEEDAQVVVEEEGYFYILIELTTNVSNINIVSDGEVRVRVHKVSNDSVATVLLEDVTSLCQMTSDGLSAKTSVLGAVFFLKPGERLHVTTSHPDSIITDPNNNHFSMYMI